MDDASFAVGGDLSKEHFWPQWASPLLPPYPINQHVERSFTVTNKTTVTSSKKRDKPGTAWTKAIRDVCQGCNKGWMNEVETAARPALIPPISERPCTVTAISAATIARWITLEVLVSEHNLKGGAVTTPEQRSLFSSTLAVPADFWIWIGRCGADGWQTAYWRHASTVSLSPDVRPEHRFKNLQSVTFGIGELFVCVLHTTVDGLSPGLVLNYEQNGMTAPLWPFREAIGWPRTKKLTAFEATYLANSLDSLIRSDKVLWRPLPEVDKPIGG